MKNDYVIKTKHAIKMTTILRLTGTTDVLKPLFTGVDISGLSEEEVEVKQREISAEIILTILENIDKADQEIYALVADIRGITPEEAEELPLGETVDTFKAIFTSEGFASFFE